jgi:hypothetical protein
MFAGRLERLEQQFLLQKLGSTRHDLVLDLNIPIGNADKRHVLASNFWNPRLVPEKPKQFAVIQFFLPAFDTQHRFGLESKSRLLSILPLVSGRTCILEHLIRI